MAKITAERGEAMARRGGTGGKVADWWIPAPEEGEWESEDELGEEEKEEEQEEQEEEEEQEGEEEGRKMELPFRGKGGGAGA